MPNYHYVGPNMGYWMQKYNISISYVAEQLNVRQVDIAHIMSGDMCITDAQLIRLSDIFAVPPKYLMPDAMDPESDEFKIASLKSFGRDRISCLE